MAVLPYRDWRPEIDQTAFIALDSWIIGRVRIARRVSIFFGAVLRGDIQRIDVGSETNIQEHALLHTSRDLPDCLVGSNVTIGHRAIIHGCRVCDNCIVGMGATILDGAVIGKNSIVGAQALVPMHAEIPEGSLVLGVPAKVVRPLSVAEIREIEASAEHYVQTGAEYRKYFSLKRATGSPV